MKKAIAVASLLLLAAEAGLAAQSCQLDYVSPQAAQTTPGSTVAVWGAGFSSGTWVYFNGMLAREISFVSPDHLKVVTPYLRPGNYPVQVQCHGQVGARRVGFTALPSPVDARIDAALLPAQLGNTSDAIASLEGIARLEPDYQVRSWIRYEEGQLALAEGNWDGWLSGAGRIFVHANRAGWSVQTYWPYRLADARLYYLDIRQTPSRDSQHFQWAVENDVTGSPEPRFYRALLDVRIGELKQAKSDSAFCLKGDPSNPSYLSLAALVAAAGGDKAEAKAWGAKARAALERKSVDMQPRRQARALSVLGEAAYASGAPAQAQQDWARAQRLYPLRATIALRAAEKHIWRGETEAAAALLHEAMALPGSRVSERAGELLQRISASSR